MSDLVAKINSFLSVDKIDYAHCIDNVQHDLKIENVVTNIRLHHLKFDGNGRPMLSALAETLYEYIVHYCIAARNRNEPLDAKQAARLTKEARQLFVHPEPTEEDPDQTGEAGEILLYFLIESILGAPQIVSKMELKTNHKKETNGSDGIHVKWDPIDKLVDFYFGESKIHKNVSGALSSAFKSISDFHNEGMYKHEFLMVTKHFKYADEEIKREVAQLILRGEPSSGIRINHACLIGYNWDAYTDILKDGASNISDDFKNKFLEDAPRLLALLNSRFEAFDKKYLRFDVFFMPFICVQEFRDAFNKALD